jgi:hypothetical protein
LEDLTIVADAPLCVKRARKRAGTKGHSAVSISGRVGEHSAAGGAVPLPLCETRCALAMCLHDRLNQRVSGQLSC